MDISEEMVRNAHEKGYSVATLERRHELYKHKFNFVFLWDVIEHVPDPRETVADLKSVMRKDAYVVVQTPMLGLLSDVLGEAFEHYLPFEHIHLFPRQALSGLFESAGFQTTKTVSFGANAPITKIPNPNKEAYDRLAKLTDNGATQVVLFRY